MISVTEALNALFALCAPTPIEHVPLRAAAGRVLAKDVAAARTQPPFAASAMDGYALRAAEAEPNAMFKVVGEAAAGHRFEGSAGPGQAVRIFTGAPVPSGLDRIIIQEDVTRRGDLITLNRDLDARLYIRPAGADFAAGERLAAPRRLTPSDIALLAAMNVATVPVHARPRVAIIATGDELVMPGEAPGPDQIIASNSFGLAAQLTALGAEPRLLPAAKDTVSSLRTALSLAADADLVVTIGGASVGDHDLVAQVAAAQGLQRAFYKVAMRPGKPLMAGRIGGAAMVGLPGNPVSALVCGEIFIGPMIRAMTGLGQAAAARATAPLAQPLPSNGPREHYMRARFERGALTAFDRQDSALLSVLARSNALIVRAPNDPERAVGDTVDYVALGVC